MIGVLIAEYSEHLGVSGNEECPPGTKFVSQPTFGNSLSPRVLLGVTLKSPIGRVTAAVESLAGHDPYRQEVA